MLDFLVSDFSAIFLMAVLLSLYDSYDYSLLAVGCLGGVLILGGLLDLFLGSFYASFFGIKILLICGFINTNCIFSV
jgi:hypothetical protein